MREWLASDFAQADLSLRITRARFFVLRVPCETPVRTSFGTMLDRPAVYLLLECADGSKGLGEVWCNFPACGAEHRAKLLETAILPALMAQEFTDPASCFATLTARFERLAIQSGEQGPIAQCLAGVDAALWDLVAKRARAPLFDLLGGSASVIGTYASGINPTGTRDTVARCREAGYTAFKLKIGFGDRRDLVNLSDIATDLREGEQMMADVNQGWSVAKALDMLPQLQSFPLRWLEEPILATSLMDDWQKLAESTSISVAAGENIMGHAGFDAHMQCGHLGVIQPDLCKWGGISGTLPVARQILKTGHRYCPHYLGGGIGLAASAHLLAAVGGDGLLEIDSNPNPLREDLFAPELTAGAIDIGDAPGIGISNNAFFDFAKAHSKSITSQLELTA